MSLKKRVVPSNKAQKIYLATKYTKLKKAPQNQNFKVWIQEWEKVYTEYIELKLPKIEGNWLVRDFVYTVESILSS